MKNNSRTLVLGIFIVVALLMLAVGVFLIGDKEFMFSSTYRLSADFQNVAGLNEGADVRVGGLREGTVEKMNLPTPPATKVTVVMKMHDPTKNIIRKDSVAVIKTEGLLGNKYLEISFGSKTAGTVADGDVIRGEPTVDVADVANALAMQTKTALAVLQEDMQALKQNFLFRGYFNKRGYEDSADLTKHAIARLPGKRTIKEFSYDAKELFEKPDTAKLKKQKTLDEAGKFLADNKFGLAVVVAHTGMEGDTAKDRILAQGQAMVVRDYLVQNFALDDTRIKTIGAGKAKQESDSSKIQIHIYATRPAAKP